MIEKLIRLEWKNICRPSGFNHGSSIPLPVFILLLCLALIFVSFGFFGYTILENRFPHRSPLNWVNRFFIYWIIADLGLRLLLQKLPISSLQSLKTVPIEKKDIAHFLLGKSIFSIFNGILLCFLIPFGITLLIKGAPPLQVAGWILALFFIELSLNYFGFLIKRNKPLPYFLFAVLFLLIMGQYFNFFDITDKTVFVFNRIYNTPYAFLIPVLLMILLYRKNHEILSQNLYREAFYSGQDVGLKDSSKEKENHSYF